MGDHTTCVERIKVHTGCVAGKTVRKKCFLLPRNRWKDNINPLNAELNPICQLLALL